MTADLKAKTEIQKLREMETLLAAIIRKVELRGDRDSVAGEVADLARRCETLVKELVRNSANSDPKPTS